MKNVLLIVLGIILMIPAWTQAQNDPRVFQFSGLILSRTTEEAIPFAQVRVNHTRQGALANPDGFYSVPVALGDTLYFSHLGYYPSKLVVKEYLDDYQGDKSQYIYAITYMLEDTFSLDSVYIFPYDTPEELRTAVINMDIQESFAERAARENLDPKVLHTLMQTLPVDGGERLMVARQMYYDYYQTKNLLPTVGFDPVAATRLLQYIAEKAKRKKNKDLNYWEY
ncbi:MAG: carboxypeptidase-like regulatory domain-containing protein [Bacteroidota bacterium]